MHINIGIDHNKSLQINLFDNPFVTKYISIMEKLLAKHGNDFDHPRCFYSWKDRGQVQEDLDSAIEYINKFFNRKVIDVDKQDPEYFNILHECFEKLNNEYDNFTILKAVAPRELIDRIDDINYCVHHLEHEELWDTRLQLQWSKHTIDRIHLEPSDYAHATTENLSDTVYLEYNEVGKSTKDLFQDNLPITYPGLKNNHFVGPDINFNFKTQPLFSSEFLKWCNENVIDPYDANNGLLNYPIGSFTYDFDMADCNPDSKITAFEIVDK